MNSDGEFAGIMTSNQARARAGEEGLDLVVIQDGDVPVCKIISYSKWKYQKEKAKKDQQKKNRQNRQVGTAGARGPPCPRRAPAKAFPSALFLRW